MATPRETHLAETTVRFAVDEESVQSTAVQSIEREMVDSLCSLVKEPGARSISLGIEFEGGRLWRARPRRRSLCVEEQEAGVPLGSLFQDSAMKMSLKEKRVLAVVIAHAVLNFCESPWLVGDWDKRHISFYGDSTGNGGIDFTRPYLSTNFRDSTQAPNEQSVFLSLHRSPAILALGVLLLEIELCKPIESHWIEEDLENGEPNFNTNLTTAERLLTQSVDEIYESYRTAIEACLNCDFALLLDDSSLENENFRQQVYEHIVAPLEEELWHGWRLTADQLQVF